MKRQDWHVGEEVKEKEKVKQQKSKIWITNVKQEFKEKQMQSDKCINENLEEVAHHMAWTETGLKTWTLFTVDTLKPLQK